MEAGELSLKTLSIKTVIFMCNLNLSLSSYSYVTSMYFVVATATTVGYGDNYAHNSNEKLFMILLEFTAICTFSWILGKITSLKKTRNVSEVLS